MADVSDCASLPIFTTHSRPEPSRTRYFFEYPPFSSLINVMRRRSGRMLVPPGPRKRSRDEMSFGLRQRIGVPLGVAFFFFDWARPDSIDGISNATNTN